MSEPNEQRNLVRKLINKHSVATLAGPQIDVAVAMYALASELNAAHQREVEELEESVSGLCDDILVHEREKDQLRSTLAEKEAEIKNLECFLSDAQQEADDSESEAEELEKQLAEKERECADWENAYKLKCGDLQCVMSMDDQHIAERDSLRQQVERLIDGIRSFQADEGYQDHFDCVIEQALKPSQPETKP